MIPCDCCDGERLDVNAYLTEDDDVVWLCEGCYDELSSWKGSPV